MAYTRCKECRQSFADNLNRCPYCGELTTEGFWTEVILGLLIAIFIVPWVFESIAFEMRQMDRIDRTWEKLERKGW